MLKTIRIVHSLQYRVTEVYDMQKLISFLPVLGLILSTLIYSFAESDQGSLDVGGIVEFGHYEQDADLNDGPEAIKWLVLDVQENLVLLLSQYGLACKPYHEKMESVRWQSCSLRTWLNDEFFLAAFSESEQDAILLSEIDNSPEQAGEYSSYVQARNTEDRVFLLSGAEFEAIPAKYGTTNKYKIKGIFSHFSPTEYALQHDNPHFSKNSYYWWLRGVTVDNINASTMKTDEKAQCVNRGSASAAADVIGCFGVHPVVWVDIDIMADPAKNT